MLDKKRLGFVLISCSTLLLILLTYSQRNGESFFEKLSPEVSERQRGFGSNNWVDTDDIDAAVPPGGFNRMLQGHTSGLYQDTSTLPTTTHFHTPTLGVRQLFTSLPIEIVDVANTSRLLLHNRDTTKSIVIPEHVGNIHSNASDRDHRSTRILRNDGRLAVVIYARFRTGSTYASEFLNQNDRFFFVFEPLKLATSSERQEHSSWWLADVLECKFRQLWELGKVNPMHSAVSLPGWRDKIFCYKYGISKDCTGLPLEEIQEKCKAFDSIAVKEIHVPSVDHLEELMSQGVKVVHVVRDPRGVASSRLKITTGTDPNKTQSTLYNKYSLYRRNAVTYCSELRQDARLIKDMYNRWHALDKALPYHLVRYEDLATDPYAQMALLYEFMGTSPDARVMSWVSAMHGHPEDHHKIKKEQAFGTWRSRPADTAVAWRTHLPWYYVQTLHEECGDVIKLLGYKLFKQEHKLRDMSLPILRAFHGLKSIVDN